MPGFDPLRYFDEKTAGQLDRSVQFAGAAAAEAIAESGITFVPERTAVVTGCALGGKPTEDDTYRQLYAEGRTRFDPMSIPKVMTNASASHISMHHGITGPCYTVSTACASAAHAIGQAFWMVRSGLVDAAVTGGTEAPVTLGMLRAWEAMRVVAPDTCRPFSRGRRGLILGEGAAFLVLEDLDAAVARGARIHAEICGFGMSSDAGHLTAPSADGAARAMTRRVARRRTGCRAGRLHQRARHRHTRERRHRNARDSRGVRRARRSSAPPSRCTATRWARRRRSRRWPRCWPFGDGVLPPTANFTEPDPECDLDVIPNQARQRAGGGRPVELVRVRRAERRAGVPALRVMGSVTG